MSGGNADLLSVPTCWRSFCGAVEGLTASFCSAKQSVRPITMKLLRGNRGANRFFYLACTALFLFFLIGSAPHRVHHAFEEHQPEQCVVFSAAKGCHLNATPTISLPAVESSIERIALSVAFWVPHFTSSPFSQRAPPAV